MTAILSTKKLPYAQKEFLLQQKIHCFDQDFITITPVAFESPSVVENAIFSSKNAVKQITNRNITIKNCFCVGDKTEAYLKKKGFSIIEKSHQAHALAEQIVKKYSEKEFTLFCGNLRREELPKLLREHQIKLTEIEVYQTLLTPKNITEPYDGVLFFSPSAVESFSEKNTFNNTIAFCIGTTTATEAKKHTSHVITASTTSIESVVTEVIKHFK